MSNLPDRCTPEEYFVPDPEAPKVIHTDVLACILSRAEANIQLLMADCESDGFTLNHNLISSALWNIDGLITQAQMVVRNSYGTSREVTHD